MNKITKVYLLDTSAILSGKPINLDNAIIVTTPGVSNELKPGGRDYQSFVYLKEKGLSIRSPSEKLIKRIITICKKTGDYNRLSNADMEILALANEINIDSDNEVIIVTDDYSIQNIANYLNIKFQTISQTGITKRFKWVCRCRGCGKKFKDNIKICPICGTETKTVISSKINIDK